MNRRAFIRAAGGIATVGVVGAGAATANSGTLVNAEVTGSGAIVATDDDFVIAGQDLTVNGGTYYTDGGNSYVVYNDGYSGEIHGNTLTVNAVPQISYPNATYGVRLDGGVVDVEDNTVAAGNGIDRRFVAVGASAGATARVVGNDVTGTHRAGVIGVGSGTDLAVRRNRIEGPGPRSSGWADNGIQLSDGATGNVVDNVVDDHWYAPNSFVSSGLIGYADEVVVQRNHFGDNDLAVGIQGERNNVIHNTVAVSYATTPTEHYGVYELGGVDNGIRQNDVSTAAGANGLIGLIVLGENAKLIRNHLSGWQTPIFDAGEDTKLPKPFAPDS